MTAGSLFWEGPLTTEMPDRSWELRCRRRTDCLREAVRTSIAGIYRQMARLTDRILKGSRPQDLPTEQATIFELVINAKTAKILGLVVPPTMPTLHSLTSGSRPSAQSRALTSHSDRSGSQCRTPWRGTLQFTNTGPICRQESYRPTIGIWRHRLRERFPNAGQIGAVVCEIVAQTWSRSCPDPCKCRRNGRRDCVRPSNALP